MTRAAGPPTLGEIARAVGGDLEGPADLVLTGVAGLDEAGPSELSFLANPRYRAALAATRAGAVLVTADEPCRDGLPRVRTKDPYAALVVVLARLDPGPPPVEGIHPTAVVHPSARLAAGVGLGPHAVVEARARVGARTRVAAGAYVGEDAALGEDVYLYPHAHVGRGCVLGDRVVLHAGAVLGSDGFGYAPVDGAYRKVPQLGIVIVEDDVEIGANACIDRATFGATRIGRGTKIDNLVQIAHNVAVGEHSALAAQSGVAGSTRLGRGVVLGGQAGLIGHLRIGDGARVAAQAGVIGHIEAGETVSGYPARPHREALRVAAHLRKLPELDRRIRALESGEVPRGTREGAE